MLHTCGLDLRNMVPMLLWLQTESFAWAHKLDHCHIPSPIHPWPYTPLRAHTRQVSSKSKSWAPHISDAAVKPSNVCDWKQTCLIIGAAMTYSILKWGSEESSLRGDWRKLQTTTDWRAGLIHIFQNYLSIIVTFRQFLQHHHKEGGRTSAAQSLPVPYLLCYGGIKHKGWLKKGGTLLLTSRLWSLGSFSAVDTQSPLCRVHTPSPCWATFQPPQSAELSYALEVVSRNTTGV